MAFDYIIVGSGIAGLYAALLAQATGSVLLLTKAGLDDSNTRHAQGGIAAAIAEDDSPELHLRDTLQAGAGLCDEQAVRVLVEEGPARIGDLVAMGVPFDRVGGKIALTREAAHSVPRVVHAGGDATGATVEASLAGLARQSERITILEQVLVTEILAEKRSAAGVRALNSQTGESCEFEGRWLVLATGGAGQLYSQNTNPEVATGDGVALAYRAGAAISDVEFFQFHPTALSLPGVPRFLISEAVRGEGGLLRTAAGRRFMPAYDSRAELAPRDIVARAIAREMAKTGDPCVYLDVTHLPPGFVAERFPTIYHFCLAHGLDMARDRLPVAPAAHYFMGGIKTNLWGETNLPGLYACGEAACTGIHGANRLASNSLLETLVFARRVVERTRGTADSTVPPAAFESDIVQQPRVVDLQPVPEQDGDLKPPSLPELQELMWARVGITRRHEPLEEARRILSAWERALPPLVDRPGHELANLVAVGRLVTEAALIREESRGAHYRADYPARSPAWHRHIVFLKEGAGCR